MKHIDKLFKEKLYNHEAKVPEGMWEKIAPIAEEESGRAILWFWFAGLLTLLLGGFGIFNLINTNTSEIAEQTTLINEIDIQPTDLLVDNSLTNTTTITTTLEENKTSEKEQNSASSTVESKPTKTSTPKIKTQQSKQVNALQNNVTIENRSAKIEVEQTISNTIESIPNAAGIPANLVITKSYINNQGSIIKQSNLTDATKDEDSYDIIFNSETKDFNAGALLRIIEPLENIPLPAFQKPLKKKTILNSNI